MVDLSIREAIRHMTLGDKNEYMLDQIAKLRIAVSDTQLSDEEYRAIRASIQALLQNLDSKRGESLRALQRTSH